ncbi:hypothetical protein QR98_0011180 [Sarcoptes scabiei]|uniref:Uncharacterized protein n=1 Tax=Sarcoptes scabiei TaxID=52283 RepID=A0A131ZX52_SARSC|nr:hypothetical protein QR98_0011180 [Sarcoptes scabiei]
MDCNLDAVSCIAWWQNLVSSGSEFDDSIAFIGNRFGMILAIDVVSGVRLRHFYVPLSIERIEISADRSSEFLLINCHKSVQYKYPLGAMRNYQIDHSDRSLVENLQSKEKSIKTLFFNQLISNKSIENKEVNHLNFDSVRCFSDSIYIEEDSGLLNTQETIEDSSIDGTKDSINDSWILSPQNHTGRIFVIKNNLQRFPNLHGNSRRNSEAEHIDSSRYSQNQIESNCYDTSLSPDSSKIEFDNPILEIYEFSLENFDIRFKAPPSTNKRYCFRINKDLVEKIQSIRLIDCGSRFFLLLLNNEICFMISKSLTSKASSDESDLIVLNQEESLSNISGLDGNLDEFINGFSLIDLSNDLTTDPKTREEFRSDSSTRSEKNRIINAFVIKPGTQNVSIEEFLKQKMNTPMNSDAQDDPEFSNQSFSKDQIFFQSLLQTKYEESIQKIDEQILIVTDRSVFVIESMEKMFGNLFHTEIQKIWTKFYSAYQEDYDIANILPYVRLMVECFVSQEVQSSQRLSFGWALHGQLGHGSIEDVYVPKLIDYFERLQNCPLIDIAAGYAHTAALDINGDLYIFGQNSYGQLGNICKTDTIKSILPRKVNLTGGPVKLISCGPFHTVVMIESEQSGNEKKIFCWGINPRIWRTRMRSINYFTIDSKKNSDKKQTISDYAKIRELSLPKINPNDQIIDIKAGQSYIIILTKSGKVFTMDYNSDHRAETSQDFDAEAMHTAEYFGSKIVDVSCGSHFVLALDSQGNLWNLGGTKSLLKAQNSADFRRFSANRERKQSISKSMFDHKRSCSDKVSLFSDGNHAKPTVIFSVSKPNQTKSLDNDVKKDSIHHYRCRQIKKNFKKKINQLKTENPVLKEQFDLLRTIIFDCYYSDFRSLIERLGFEWNQKKL